MLYDSLDIIPLKTYLKIDSTGNLSLLTDDFKNLSTDKLKEVWKSLKKDYSDLGINPGAKKVLDVYVRIERLRTKYDFVIAATNALNFERVDEFENTLREWGYRLSPKNYLDDLSSIKTQAGDILIKISRLETQIERKTPKKTGKPKTVDQLIMGYMSAIGVVYDTNKVTVTQFHAMQMQFEEKLKAIEKTKQNAPKKEQLKSKTYGK